MTVTVVVLVGWGAVLVTAVMPQHEQADAYLAPSPHEVA